MSRPIIKKADRHLKFEDEKDIDGRTVIAAIFRTGCNLLKNIIEDITGFYVGDQFSGDCSLSHYLQELDNVKGQAIGCRVIKTHFPIFDHPFLRIPGELVVEKAILTVRNPVDIISSYFELNLSQDFHSVLSEDDYVTHKDYFEEIITCLTPSIKYFHQYWTAQKIPKYVIKYNELMENSEKVLREVFTFLEEKEIKGTKTEAKLLERQKTKGMSSSFMAKPRSSGSKIHKFSEEQLLCIAQNLEEFLVFYSFEQEFIEALGKKGEFLKNSKFPKANIEKMNEEAIKNLLNDKERSKKPRETITIPSSESFESSHPWKIVQLSLSIVNSHQKSLDKRENH